MFTFDFKKISKALRKKIKLEQALLFSTLYNYFMWENLPVWGVGGVEGRILHPPMPCMAVRLRSFYGTKIFHI